MDTAIGLHASRGFQQAGKGQELSGLDLANQFVSGADAAVIEVYRGATMEQAGDRTQSLSAVTNSPEAQARIEFAEGGTWIASGILGMAASVESTIRAERQIRSIAKIVLWAHQMSAWTALRVGTATGD